MGTVHRQRKKQESISPSKVLGLPHELHRCADLFGVHIDLVIVQGLQLSDGPHDGSTVPDCLNHIACSSLALRPTKAQPCLSVDRDDDRKKISQRATEALPDFA